MENTKANKSKFFGIYFGQQVMKCSITNQNTHYKQSALMNVDINQETTKDNWFLELKPLSAISDQEALEIVTISNHYPEGYLKDLDIFKNSDGDVVLGIIGKSVEHRTTIQCLIKQTIVADYLRSKGYATSFNGVSFETLIDYGWVTLKTE